MRKLFLYFNTVRYMKPSQIYYRIRRMRKREISIGIEPKKYEMEVNVFRPIRELDYDRDFIARFNIEEFKSGVVTFLNSSEKFDWNTEWIVKKATPLWNFNLHYFEYLFPFAKDFEENKNEENLEFANECISSWIKQNPSSKRGIGWESYTIALRLTNWIEYYSILERFFDDSFKERIQKSIYEQYEYLSKHLEKDLLGNHYFENLKSLILCSIFLGDDNMLNAAIKEFRIQCDEQILADGMHFELSPMYHKIILEDVIRVAYTLKCLRKDDEKIEKYIQPMLNIMYSLEEGIDRVPLFNDSGNNVSKSMGALLKSAYKYFDITPRYSNAFKESGFFILKEKDWKVVIDAGQPGATYIPGHVHCDAMSFELFKEGRPVIVNCGTYAYQCDERVFFRSTEAHNTVMVEGVEQSECWGGFRLAKRAKIRVIEVSDNHIKMKLIDCKNNVVYRTICIKDGSINIVDRSKKAIQSFIHINGRVQKKQNIFLINDKYVMNFSAEMIQQKKMLYSEGFGEKKEIDAIMISGRKNISIRIQFN